MEIDNPLTPQPGDVWEQSGTIYFIADPLGESDRPFFRIDDGEHEFINIDEVNHILTEHIDKLGWRYIGRASDLIGEALARREELQTPDESPAEAIESFVRKLLRRVGADKRLRVEIAGQNHITFDVRPYSIPREYIAEIEEFAGQHNYSVTITAGEVIG